MSTAEPDRRSPQQKSRDDELAREPPRPAFPVPPGAQPEPLEAHLQRPQRRPAAYAGIVVNGVVRLVDPGVRLPERARVIVVTPEV